MFDTSRSFPQGSVADAVGIYVGQRGRGGLVSLHSAVQTIRTLLPDCEHTDRELSELVAAEAVRVGCAVAFDPCEEMRRASGTSPDDLPARPLRP